MISLQDRLNRPSIRLRSVKFSQSLLRAVPSGIVIAIATFACFAFRTYVRTLRKKIEDDPAQPKYILTEPRVGYRFHNPSEEEL
jgi:DNA-binding winged helix-turn-helix (wHTH) protein